MLVFIYLNNVLTPNPWKGENKSGEGEMQPNDAYFFPPVTEG